MTPWWVVEHCVGRLGAPMVTMSSTKKRLSTGRLATPLLLVGNTKRSASSTAWYLREGNSLVLLGAIAAFPSQRVVLFGDEHAAARGIEISEDKRALVNDRQKRAPSPLRLPPLTKAVTLACKGFISLNARAPT
jgi:hypothetical protein